MKIEELFTNKGHSVGIVKISGDERKFMKPCVGYFNKELLKELTELFDLFDRRDMKLYFFERDEATILLLSPDEDKDVFLSVAGKTDVMG